MSDAASPLRRLDLPTQADLLANLREALQANLLMDAAVRQAAELRMQQLRSLPGFAACLVQLTLEPTGSVEVRQLAAVVLKHFVHADWPRLPDAEKAGVRAALPSGLRDGHTRIRTAVSVVIAGIAKTDWPEAWPTLLADLMLPLEEAGAATDTVAGVLRCLEICAAELAVEHMRPALQRLLPRLLEVFVNSGGLHGARTRARAVRVLHKLVERVSMLCDDRQLLQQLQRGPLAEWAGAALRELAAPLSEYEDCSVPLALLRLLRLLAEHAPLALKPHKARHRGPPLRPSSARPPTLWSPPAPSRTSPLPLARPPRPARARVRYRRRCCRRSARSSPARCARRRRRWPRSPPTPTPMS